LIIVHETKLNRIICFLANPQYPAVYWRLNTLMKFDVIARSGTIWLH